MTTGVFIRELSQSIHGTPRQAAERAASAAVDFVVFAILWQDRGRRQRFMNERSLLDYALVMRDVGVDVWLWSYPWVEMEELCVRTFRRRTDELGGAVSGWIIDPELGYKWDHEHPEGVVRRGAQSLMEGLVDAADESIDIGVTSYGAIHLPCHSNFPWDVFTAYGIQIPQIYNMARSMVKRCLDGWRAVGDYPGGASLRRP